MGQLLQRVLTLDNLRIAWEAVAENRGMAGVDDVSIQRWRRDWEERLVNLVRDVRANRYKPGKLRIRRIPKRTGREYRTLRIPTVTDRVLQRAVLQVLYDVYEPLFLRCSFGYRPGKSLRDAVQYIILQREAGFTWVLDADIDAFFDNVDQPLLLDFLKQQIGDAQLLQLIAGWLAQGRPTPDLARGIPQGSPLSPLLANVYLHPLDVGLTDGGWRPVRYADDFVVFATTQAKIEAAYCCTEALLADLRLRYELSKTRISSFAAGFEFLGVLFEGNVYRYRWEDKLITVDDTTVDWLFGDYGPTY